MKGVILAGGTGSRLFPSTKVTNKHLLPVFNKPMIYYPIETLRSSGINDILIISSPEHAGDFMQLLGSGIDFNVNFTYKIQDGAGGIAQRPARHVPARRRHDRTRERTLEPRCHAAPHGRGIPTDRQGSRP